jgi:hypothetical protein
LEKTGIVLGHPDKKMTEEMSVGECRKIQKETKDRENAGIT